MNEQLSKLIPQSGPMPERDAIHIAIAPVVAVEILYPGQDIGFVTKGNTELAGTQAEKCIGIVDPFLKGRANPDQRFWMLLYPNTITTLRHYWEHPDYHRCSVDPEGESKRWLEAFAKNAGLQYAEMIEIITEYHQTGEVWVEHGGESARNAFDAVDVHEFWRHVQRVIGLEEPSDASYFYSPFSCSC